MEGRLMQIRQEIQDILDTTARDSGFSAVLRVIVKHFQAHMGTIHGLAEGDGHLYLLGATDGIPEPVLAASRRIPLGKGIAGASALQRKPVSLCNLQTDDSGVARPGARATGAHGALCVPLFLGDKVVGALGIGCQGDRVFTEDETTELLDLGRILAPYVANSLPSTRKQDPS